MNCVCYDSLVSTTPVDLARSLAARTRVRREGHLAERDRIVARVQVLLPMESARLALGNCWLIGSLLTDHFGERSDIDLVVEHGSPEARATLADVVGQATGRAVDVLSIDELPAAFKARVLAEGRRVA